MLGERGGTTASLNDARRFIEAHKGDRVAQLRSDILDWLDTHAEWHVNDLRVPDPDRIIGSVVAGLIAQRRIEKTGERRKATAKASHGRDSNVFRLSTGGRGRRKHPAACREPKVEAVAELSPEVGTGDRVSSPARLFEMPEEPGLIDLDQRAA